MMSADYELGDVPLDGISSLAFSPDDPGHLLVPSWDKKVRLYDAIANSVQLVWNHEKPVLDVCFVNNTYGVGVGLERSVRCKELETGVEMELGTHAAPIKCVEYGKMSGLLYTGDWGGNLCVWDMKCSKHLVSNIKLPEKVYSMDIVNNTLVVAMAARRICIFDIRSIDKPLQTIDSPLKFMTRVVKCMPNGEGYVCGSVEGRISVEYFNSSKESQDRKCVFKCHRRVINDIETVYPVNAIAFCKVYNTFASGGSDGIVSVWDARNRKRIKQYPNFNNEISALAINCNDTLLAVAASYVYDQGDIEHLPDTIHIHPISLTDYKSKSV